MLKCQVSKLTNYSKNNKIIAKKLNGGSKKY